VALLLVDYDPDAETQIVLPRAGNEEGRANGLKRRWDQYDSGLLVAAVDDVPVDLDRSNVDPIVELNIDPSSERHCKTRLVHVKVTDTEDGGKLRTVDVELLDGDSEQCMSERFEARPVFHIVLDLDTAQEILHS